MEAQKIIVLQGKVIHGRGIGKLVGSPTANLELLQGSAIPEQGVYTSRILLNGQSYYGVTHIGKRPTVDNDENVSVEVHFLNFNQEIYGEVIRVQLYMKLREPQKFNDLSALLNQIRHDCIETRKFFRLNDLPASLYMDIEKHRVSIGKEEISLSSKEFDVLYLLYSNPDVTFSKEQMYEDVWHELPNGCFHAVENTIFQIRKKLRPHLGGTNCIKTIVGYGYRFQTNQ